MSAPSDVLADISGCGLDTQAYMTTPTSGDVVDAGPVRQVSDFQGCDVYQVNPRGLLGVNAGGSVGNVIFAGGSATVQDGGRIEGFAAAGGVALPSDGSGGGVPSTYGGKGDLTINGGGFVSVALVGPGAVLRADGTATKLATIGRIETSGVTRLEYAALDLSKADDYGSGAAGVLEISGASAWLSHSRIRAGVGSRYVGVNFSESANSVYSPGSYSLRMDHSVIDEVDGGIMATQSPRQAPAAYRDFQIALGGSTVHGGQYAGLDLRNLIKGGVIDAVLSDSLVTGQPGIRVLGQESGIRLRARRTTIESKAVGSLSSEQGIGLDIGGGAEVYLEDASRVEGPAAGIRIGRRGITGSVSSAALLRIRGNSVVAGGLGAAVQVSGAGATADLYVSDGSRLIGGNGAMLEVDGAATARLTLTDSHLAGDVAAQGSGTRVSILAGSGGGIAGRHHVQDGAALSVRADGATALLSGSFNVGQDGTGRMTLAAGAAHAGLLSARGQNAQLDVEVGGGGQARSNGGMLLTAMDGARATVRVDGALIFGDIGADDKSRIGVALANGAVFVGNATVASMDVASASRWGFGATDQHIQDLIFSNGEIAFMDGTGRRPPQMLRLGSLSAGQGQALFSNFRVDFSTASADRIHVRQHSSGRYGLQVVAAGGGHALAAEVLPASILVIESEDKLAATAEFRLRSAIEVNERPVVDLGPYTYSLDKDSADGNWYLRKNAPLTPVNSPAPAPFRRYASPSAKIASGVLMGGVVVMNTDLAALRLRLGDLRRDRPEDGVWGRTHYSSMRISPAQLSAFSLDQYGLQIGVDRGRTIGDSLFYGGFALSLSQSNLKAGGDASASMQNAGLAAYGGLLSKDGWYLDAMLAAFYENSRVRALMSDGRRASGHYGRPGLGLTLEAGRHIPLNERWFAEPFLRATGVTAGAVRHRLNNGLEIVARQGEAAQLELGALLGTALPDESNKGIVVLPYAKASMVRQVLFRSPARLNGLAFDENMRETQYKIGAGLRVAAHERLQFHADLDHFLGNRFKRGTTVAIGVKYVW